MNDVLRIRLAEVTDEITMLTVSRRKLKERQESLRREQKSIRRYLSNPPSHNRRNGSSDWYCVPSALLIREIEDYIAKTGDTQIAICEKANIDPTGLRRMRRGEIKFSTLALADDLLTAIGRSNKLGNEIPIVPNPYRKINEPTGY